MQDYIIATASTADLSRQWLDEHNVPFISYHYTLDGKEYDDDCREESRNALYDAMRKGIGPTTAAISVYEYHNFFTRLMSEGKPVLYLDMSAAISSSINNARTAADMIKKEYPEQKFYFLDSFCITDILGLLVKKLVAMKESGSSYEEVIDYGEKHKLEYIGKFMVDDLNWLKRGGRLSNGSAFFGMLLSIKPLIYVSQNGQLIAYEKCHGRRKACARLIDSMKIEMTPETKNEEVCVIHSGTPEDAEEFKERIQAQYPELTNVTVNTLGPVITAHTGPGFMAVVYHGSKRIM